MSDVGYVCFYLFSALISASVQTGVMSTLHCVKVQMWEKPNLKCDVFSFYTECSSMCNIINMTINLFSPFKASFPGNLHLVLVLRPTSFFHRTVTDIGFRFSQEDFMLKMPVRQLLLSYQTCPTSQQGTTDLHESNILWWTQPRTHF